MNNNANAGVIWKLSHDSVRHSCLTSSISAAWQLTENKSNRPENVNFAANRHNAELLDAGSLLFERSTGLATLQTFGMKSLIRMLICRGWMAHDAAVNDVCQAVDVQHTDGVNTLVRGDRMSRHRPCERG